MLEKEIRELINETINGKYIGKLRVEYDENMEGGPLYMLFLYLDLEQTPMVLARQGTKEAFLDFVKTEIQKRKLQITSFRKLELTYESEDKNWYDDE